MAFAIAGLAILGVFGRRRRKARDHAEAAEFRSRLPWEVRLFERIVFIVPFVAMSIVFCLLAMRMYARVHPEAATLDPGALSGILIAASSCAMAIAPSALLANFVSWLTPPIRRANKAAMSGLITVSYRTLSIGLVWFGLPLTLVCALLIVLGVLAPWAS